MQFQDDKERVRQRIKNTLSVMVAFMLALLLTMMTYMTGVYFGLLSTQNLVNSFSKVDYYAQSLDAFEETAWDYTIALSLPRSVLDGIATKDMMAEDIENSLRAGLANEVYEVDTEDLRTKLDENVSLYLSEAQLTLDEEQKSGLEEYKDSIAEEYIASVEFPMASYLGYIKQLCNKYLPIGYGILAVLSAVAVIFLLRIRHWKHRGVRYIACAAFGTMWMSLLLPGVGLLSGVYKKIQITPVFFKELISRHLENTLLLFLYLALFWLLIALLLLFYIRHKKAKIKENKA
ncbi:MAG: hypothetical protein ACK5MN_00710 [Lachnospiraceae bacterium]